MEKGRNHLLDPDDLTKPAGDYSNDEIKFVSRYFLGPDPLVEPRAFRRSAEEGEHTHVGEVNSIPTTVGGGGTHADGKVPRFREEDFGLLSTYGPQEGAAVDDWPLDYDELEPYYAEVERAIGVSGREGANPFAAWRSGPYPMPPGAPMYGAVLSSAAAEKVGLHPYEAPTAANSIAYDGRPACNNCGFCAFFGCPIHAKGDPVALLTKAMATGRAELMAETYVSRIITEGRRATGVEFIGPDGVAHTRERRAGHRGGGRHRDAAPPAALGPGPPRARQVPDGALPDHRRRALPDHAPAPPQGARRHPRARRRHGAGRPLAGRGRRRRAAVVPRRPGRAQRGRPADHGGAPLALGAPPRPGHARVEPARAHVGLHHAGGGPGLRHQHGRPEPVHPRRPRLPGGPGDLPAGPPRAGGVEVPRQDPPVRPGGDGRRMGDPHLVAGRLVPRHRRHADPREPPRHGHGAHGGRPRDLGRGPLGEGALARQRRGRRLLGLRHLQWLRADADPGGPGGAGGAPPGGDDARGGRGTGNLNLNLSLNLTSTLELTAEPST